jgi:hypothetical protein
MKIRTVTTFANLSYPAKPEELERVAAFNKQAKLLLEQRGLEVQETRIATSFFEGARLNLSSEDVIAWVVNIQSICTNCGIDFVSLGTIRPGAKASTYRLISDIICQTETVSLSVSVSMPDGGLVGPAVREAATAIKEISEQTERGTGNFRFGVLANCPAFVPFFPSAYHDGGLLRFSIGFESGSDLYEIAHKLPSGEAAVDLLHEEFESAFKTAEETCEELSKSEGMEYCGADLSLNPGILESESVCLAIEKLAGGSFGCPGTLRVAAMLTEVLRSMRVVKCGYSGIFLPVLEDYGLVRRANEGMITLPILLAVSSVCGAGLDAIPLPGDIPVEKIEAILLDVAALSRRAGKPLSARLLPAPGKGAGEITDFRIPFLIDCATLPL